jgi:alpha-galactosidase
MPAERRRRHALRRVCARRVAAPLLGAALLAASLAPGAGAKSAPVLAATPYMGWDTYFAFGAHISESTVLEQASNLITSGLQKDGYRLIWLDVGWWQGQRYGNGQIKVSPTEWPHGMAWLAQTLHAEGFKVGIYTDAGINGCGGINEGLYGHYQQDINTFAKWGFDAVKVDFCGGDDLHLKPSVAYGEIHQAIVHNSSHRPMMLNICVFPQPGQVGDGFPSFANSAFESFSFGPSDGTSWRTDTDVGSPTGVPWSSVVRNIEADATEPRAAGPGHWNDPDYLGPNLGLTDAQFQTQASMWAMLAAPLMVSVNLSTLSPASLATLTNPQMIAIDQDRRGIQGVQVAPAAVASTPASANGEAWIKPLERGRYAVALLNLGSSTLTISTSAQAVGIPSASSYSLANVWAGGTSTTSGAIAASVPADSTVVFIVSPG